MWIVWNFFLSSSVFIFINISSNCLQTAISENLLFWKIRRRLAVGSHRSLHLRFFFGFSSCFLERRFRGCQVQRITQVIESKLSRDLLEKRLEVDGNQTTHFSETEFEFFFFLKNCFRRKSEKKSI